MYTNNSMVHKSYHNILCNKAASKNSNINVFWFNFGIENIHTYTHTHAGNSFFHWIQNQFTKNQCFKFFINMNSMQKAKCYVICAISFFSVPFCMCALFSIPCHEKLDLCIVAAHIHNVKNKETSFKFFFCIATLRIIPLKVSYIFIILYFAIKAIIVLLHDRKMWFPWRISTLTLWKKFKKKALKSYKQ